jgi:hypothetical protein
VLKVLENEDLRAFLTHRKTKNSEQPYLNGGENWPIECKIHYLTMDFPLISLYRWKLDYLMYNIIPFTF